MLKPKVCDFERMLGETIVAYQAIETDLRAIYARSSGGDFEENLESVSGFGLGRMVGMIAERCDSCMMSRTEVRALERLAERRNHWVHGTYLEIAGDPRGGFRREYEALRADRDEAVRMRDAVRGELTAGVKRTSAVRRQGIPGRTWGPAEATERLHRNGLLIWGSPEGEG